MLLKGCEVWRRMKDDLPINQCTGLQEAVRLSNTVRWISPSSRKSLVRVSRASKRVASNCPKDQWLVHVAIITAAKAHDAIIRFSSC